MITTTDHCNKFYSIKDLKKKIENLKATGITKNADNKKLITSGTKKQLCERVAEFLDYHKDKQKMSKMEEENSNRSIKAYSLKDLKEIAQKFKSQGILKNKKGETIIISGSKKQIYDRLSDLLMAQTNENESSPSPVSVPVLSKNINTSPTVFVFYSKSADKPPGKGNNENLDNSENFDELSKIKDWRKKLSNFHVEVFQHYGYTFNTAEHAFHFRKFQLFNKDIAYEFALESNSDLSKNDGKAAQKQRKKLLLNHTQLIKWSKVRNQVMAEILHDKFSKSRNLQHLLLLTKNAQLWHFLGRGHKKGENLERWTHLEKIRNMMFK